jgi:hypothetical protein
MVELEQHPTKVHQKHPGKIRHKANGRGRQTVRRAHEPGSA